MQKKGAGEGKGKGESEKGEKRESSAFGVTKWSQFCIEDDSPKNHVLIEGGLLRTPIDCSRAKIFIPTPRLRLSRNNVIAADAAAANA